MGGRKSWRADADEEKRSKLVSVVLSHFFLILESGRICKWPSLCPGLSCVYVRACVLLLPWW